MPKVANSSDDSKGGQIGLPNSAWQLLTGMGVCRPGRAVSGEGIACFLRISNSFMRRSLVNKHRSLRQRHTQSDNTVSRLPLTQVSHFATIVASSGSTMPLLTHRLITPINCHTVTTRILSVTDQANTPKAYCSKKLLALLDDTSPQNHNALAAIGMDAIVRELAQRGHYLTELSDRGLINASQPPRH